MSYAHASQYDQTCAYLGLFILDICMLHTFIIVLVIYSHSRDNDRFFFKELIPR